MQWNNDMREKKKNMRWSVDKALQLPLYTLQLTVWQEITYGSRWILQTQILIKVYQLTLGILAQLLRSVQCHPLCSNKCNWGQAHVLPAVPISQVRSALRPLNHGLARYVWSPRSCYAPFSSSHSVPTALHRGTNTHHLIPICSEDSSVQMPLPHDAQVHNKHLVPKESKRCFRELTELSGPMTTQRSEQECRSSKFQSSVQHSQPFPHWMLLAFWAGRLLPWPHTAVRLPSFGALWHSVW